MFTLRSLDNIYSGWGRGIVTGRKQGGPLGDGKVRRTLVVSGSEVTKKVRLEKC